MKKIILNFLFFINWNYFNLIYTNIKSIITLISNFSAFLNYLSFLKIIFNKYICLYSRSRNIFWFKGLNSKNFQILKYLYLDCDMDVLVLKMLQTYNVTCHTNYYFCYNNKINF